MMDVLFQDFVWAKIRQKLLLANLQACGQTHTVELTPSPPVHSYPIPLLF